MSRALMPSSRGDQPVRPSVDEFPELEEKLSLMCGPCGRTGKYGVGRVFLDPERLQSFIDRESSFDDVVTFTGIFYCKHCGAAGPWKLPMLTRIWLLAMLKFSSKQGEYGVQRGHMQAFDGTVVRTGAEAEAYLKQKLEEQPDNAYVWGRLGNLYSHAGFLDLAKRAYETALHLDPSEFESRFNLGKLLRDKGDAKGAAECFESAMRHAKAARHTSPDLREAAVQSCLENLFELHCETEGEIPFPPKFAAPAPVPGEGPDVIGMLDVNLSSDEGWEILTSIYLTGKIPEPVRERAANARVRAGKSKPQPNDPPASEPERLVNVGGTTVREAKRTGRNDPCPCGSGKKYKRCCLPR